LVRAATALARLQPDLGQVLTPHDAGRLRLLRRMVDRLSEERALDRDCSPEEALDILWLLTSFDAYDILARGRDLTQDAVADHLTMLAKSRIAPQAALA
jgi:hypothetical protein